MSKKRKVIKEMFDAVERGQAFTVYGHNEEPLAIVLPWDSWLQLNTALREAEERMLPPLQRRLTDPEERLPEVGSNYCPDSSLLNYGAAMMGAAGGMGGDGGSGGPGAEEVASKIRVNLEPRCEHCHVVGGGHARNCIGAGAHDYSEGPPL